MKGIIYYFTGTGNSLKIARDLANVVDQAELIQICSDNIGDDVKCDYDVVGIVYPVYYWGLPSMVREFIEKLILKKDAYVFAVANYGASSGMSMKQINKALGTKGMSLSGEFGIAMPGNYQLMYNPYSQEQQGKCFENQENKIGEIAKAVNGREIVKHKEGGVARVFGGLLYKTFKPSNSGKNFWVEDKCNGCGICSKVCPANNIDILERKPNWKDSCEQCLACLQWCPKQAVQYKKKTLKRGRYQNPSIKAADLFQKNS